MVAAPDAGPDLSAPKPPDPGGFVPPAGGAASGIDVLPGGANPQPPGQGGIGALQDPITYGDDPALDALWDQCAAGDWAACDALFTQGAPNTHYQAWGFTCGNRIAHSNGDCQAAGAASAPSPQDPQSYGDDAYFDNLWELCDLGDWDACDRLGTEALLGSNYARHGFTCGNRRTALQGAPCASSMIHSSYGDNPHFDGLWDRCAQEDWYACDLLYDAAPTDTEYASFGLKCGRSYVPTNDNETCLDSLGDARSYGDSWYFDQMYDTCLDIDHGLWAAICDTLYNEAPIGSQYEQIAGTCGLRVDAFGTCATLFTSTELDRRLVLCEGGSMVQCDALYRESPGGSYYEQAGLTCGGFGIPASGTCTDR